MPLYREIQLEHCLVSLFIVFISIHFFVDPEIGSILLSRLAVSSLIDSLQDNGSDVGVITQLIPLLQNLFLSGVSCTLIIVDTKCRLFLLDHNIVSVLVSCMQINQSSTVIVHTCGRFLDIISRDGPSESKE